MPIVDQGYQHWSGKLAGRRWRWLAITRHGVKVALRSYFLRYVLLAAWVPALALVTMLSCWGLLERKSSLGRMFIAFMRFINPGVVADPRYYRVEIWQLSYGYFFHVELFFAMIIILLVGPGLISQDRRVNALPLYFSRPLRRIDYFLGKLGIIFTFLGMVLILPAVVAYIFGLLFSLDISVVADTFPLLLAVIAYGLIIVVSAGTLMLALSALSRNSRYVALAWLGLWFISAVLASVLQGVHQQQLHYARMRTDSWSKGPAASGASLAARPQHPLSRRIARRPFEADGFTARLQDARTNWRPLLSYTGNLSRLGDYMLGTNAAWRKLAKLEPSLRQQQSLLVRFSGPRYPWYWSAAVLAGLLGFSLCILHWSIRSLDRLK